MSLLYIGLDYNFQQYISTIKFYNKILQYISTQKFYNKYRHMDSTIKFYKCCNRFLDTICNQKFSLHIFLSHATSSLANPHHVTVKQHCLVIMHTSLVIHMYVYSVCMYYMNILYVYHLLVL